MATRPTYKAWTHQIAETNKCAHDFLEGKVPQDTMDNFFDHESGIFCAWRDSEDAPFDKDWTGDYNR